MGEADGWTDEVEAERRDGDRLDGAGGLPVQGGERGGGDFA
jgi:hypothetical protein